MQKCAFGALPVWLLLKSISCAASVFGYSLIAELSELYRCPLPICRNYQKLYIVLTVYSSSISMYVFFHKFDMQGLTVWGKLILHIMK